MDCMGHRIVSQQLAAYVAEQGGASVSMHTGKHAEGPGFMVADHGSETRSSSETPTAGEIQNFADQQWPNVSGDHRAHLGVWGNVMDVSRKVSVGSEARTRGREHLQESAYALGSESSPKGTPTRISATENTDTLHRPYGAEVLLNMGRTPKAEREAPRVVGVESRRRSNVVPKRPDEETPIFRDMADPSVQADPAWARSSNPNDFNLNEVENDAWTMTAVHAPQTIPHTNDGMRRTNLGDVLRTINAGRTREARGEGLVAHPTKGWHPRNAGPSKVKRSEEQRSAVKYGPELEAERGR